MDLSIILGIGFSGMSTWQAVLYMICGLGLFLYGIELMGNALRVMAGNRMKNIIEKFTNTPIKGLLVGFLVTMITQSASGTSALAVSLVAAGLMSFRQSLGVLLGANIGGVVLTIILAAFSKLKIMPIVSVILVGFGALFVFFSKKKKLKQIGSIMLGFGLIFLGSSFISMSFDTINQTYETQITNLFTKLSRVPVVGIILGILFTVVVQSSSCTIGIIQDIYSIGSISLKGALAIMLGANVGTTITALLASLGSSKSAKKVAIANILIKFFGVVVFAILFHVYLISMEKLFESTNLLGSPMAIAIAHLIFNIINSGIFLFLLKPLAVLCDKIIKGDDESDLEKQLGDFLLIKKSPALAIEFVKKAVDYMGSETKAYFKLAKDYSFDNIPGTVEKGAAFEHEINGLDTKIHNYLIKLTATDLNSKQTNVVSKYLDTIKDLERIGDHATNIIEFFSQRYDAHLHLSAEGKVDLGTMFETLERMVNNSIDAISTWDKELAKTVCADEDTVDHMEEHYRKRHILRLNRGVCSVSNLDYYVDILSNLERVGDHSNNIAENVINDDYMQGDVYNH